MTPLLWALIAAQIAMGAFDMLFHHELTERLAWRPAQARELKLHAVRNLFYACLFLVFGFTEPHGAWAVVVLFVLAAELIITLADFVEEDRSRKLPASERVTHALLALNYGAILVTLVPVLMGWAAQSAGLVFVLHGWWSWFLGTCAFGVAVFGVRDFAASARCRRIVPGDAARLARGLPHQTILVTGATGFIGRRLTEALVARGHRAIVLTRDAAKAAALPAPHLVITRLDQLGAGERIDAIVNLAGEPIGDGPWTRRKRAEIVRSRVAMTGAIVRLIGRLTHKPDVLINGSAIGWYGLRGDETLEEDSDSQPCFSHDVCAAWEEAARGAEQYGVRLVLLRIGLVLGIEGGMLARLLLPFEFGFGGPIGSGRQWMSWIERDDLVRLIVHAMTDRSIAGALNATAPIPVTNAEFARALGRALHRPAFLRLPAAPLRLVLGDFANELLLGGQRVLPRKALASGFMFEHPQLGGALADIVGAGSSSHLLGQAAVVK